MKAFFATRDTDLLPTADFAIGSALRSVTRFATVAMDAHPEDAQQTVPDVVTEVAAEPADDAPAEGTPTPVSYTHLTLPTILLV